MYPTYALQVYDHNQSKWIDCSHHEASNAPHTYDQMRAHFDQYIASAKPTQAPIGYRITADGEPYDVWENAKLKADREWHETVHLRGIGLILRVEGFKKEADWLHAFIDRRGE